MKLHRSIAAGTAMALLMAAPVSAAPAVPRVPGASQTMNSQQPLILAQATTVEELRRRLEEEELTAEERAAIEAEIEALEAAAPAEEAPVEETPAEEAPAEEAPAEEAPAEETAPEQPAAEEGPAPAEEPAAEEAPAEEPAAEEPPVEEPAVEEPEAEEPAAEETPAEEPAAEEPAAEEAPAEEPAAQEPAAEEPAVEEAPVEEPTAEEPAAEETPAEEPAVEEAAPAEEAPAAEEAAPADGDSAEAPASEDAAPVLDSQKEADVSGDASSEPVADDEASSAPPPETDADAQASAAPTEVKSATAAEGTRVEESEARGRERERRSDAEVIAEVAGRVILSLAGRQVVEHDDRDRLRRGAEEVYYEDLRRGRTRETIVRRNGTRIVTIRDRYGDIIRRSRITPDGREYILVYAGDRDGDDDDGRRNRWRDPGRDLPPLRLRIPVREYILDADRVDDPDRYYEFLDQPPIENVRRLYSIDEVKYSARIRDTVRRVDLDNITFDFGSADISESEIAKLEGVANAMARLLDENPAETFLIEGHTDAVGTETANLSLSDRRAETVAQALTDVFEIPPENLVTQGYGEAYLKVNTEEPNRTNRRVAVRRITPLVTVASQ